MSQMKFIKEVLFTLVAILCLSGVTRGQQFTTDPGKLAGDWKLEKVEMKQFSKIDHRLIRTASFSNIDSIRDLPALVPSILTFNGPRCVIRTDHSAEMGQYMLTDSILLIERGLHTMNPGKVQDTSAGNVRLRFNYEHLAANKLVLVSSAVFFPSKQDALPVREVFRCFYSRNDK